MTKKHKFIFGLLITIYVLVVLLGMIVIPSLYSWGIFLCAHPMKIAEEGQIRVACVGDSITYGHGVKNWTENAYPFVLNDLLGDNYCVNNFGYSNRTLISTGNEPYRDEKLYQKSLDFNPNIVIIMLGTNDTKSYNWIDQETFVSEYVDLVNSYKSLSSNPEIYVMAPMRTKDGVQLKNDIVKNEINEAVEEVSLLTGSYFIDLYEVFEETEGMYYIDGIHPNYKGARLIAETVYNNMNK